MKKILLLIITTIYVFAFQSRFLPEYNININCSKILQKSKMDICYSYKTKTPKMVIYKIKRKNLLKKHYKRKYITFKADYQIPRQYRAYSYNYIRTGYDRGHLCPNAVFNYNKKLQKETFLTSNIAPQKPMLNRYLWAKIERFARYAAMQNKTVKVITGVCGKKEYIDNKIIVPKYWYKIIFNSEGNYLISFLVPNINTLRYKKDKIRNFVSNINELEKTCNFKIQ